MPHEKQDQQDQQTRALRRIEGLLHQVDWKLNILYRQGIRVMQTLEDLQTEVAAEGEVIQSAVTLLNGLAAQVAALQPNQAAIDALAASISSQTATLAAAVTANTPAAPAPAPDAPAT